MGSRKQAITIELENITAQLVAATEELRMLETRIANRMQTSFERDHLAFIWRARACLRDAQRRLLKWHPNGRKE